LAFHWCLNEGFLRLLLGVVLWATVFWSRLFAADEAFRYPNRLDGNLLEQLRQAQPQKQGVKKYAYVLALKNSRPESVRSVVSTLYPDVKVAMDSRTRSIQILATPSDARAIQKVVDRIDKALPQIQIEVRILEVTTFSLRDYKNGFSDLTSGFRINYDFDQQALVPASKLEGFFRYLSKEGQTKVLARPTISTLDNHPSIIRVGDRIPYVTTRILNQTQVTEVHFLDTGITLSLHPRLSDNDRILIDIRAEISSVKLWKELAGAQYPILSTRKTETVVDIQDGQTLVIAGLLDSTEKQNQSAVPILSDVPIVGALFKGEDKETLRSDIIFLIRPKILRSGKSSDKKKALE